MLTLTRVLPEVESTLHALATQSGRSVDELASDALADKLEDWQDYLEAVEILRTENPAERITSAQLRAELGMEG